MSDLWSVSGLLYAQIALLRVETRFSGVYTRPKMARDGEMARLAGRPAGPARPEKSIFGAEI